MAFGLPAKKTDRRSLGVIAEDPNGSIPPIPPDNGREKPFPEDFTKFYRQYLGLALSVCRNYLSDKEEVKDVLQLTFLKAWLHVSTFKGDSSVGTWIYGICRNECLQSLRKKRSLARQLDEFLHCLGGHFSRCLGHSGCSVETKIDSRRFLRKFFQRKGADPLSNLIYMMRKLDDTTVENIATYVKLSPTEVSERLADLEAELFKKVGKRKPKLPF